MAELSLKDGMSNTYSGSIPGLVGVAGAILTFTAPTLYGQIMRLTRISVTATATAAGDTVISLAKYSTLATGGTGASVATTPHDGSGNVASTVVTSYTAAPTVGSIIGTPLRAANFTAAVASTGQSYAVTWQFGDRASQCPRLYAPRPAPGTPAGVQLPVQQLALLTSATLTGASYAIDFEFTEDIF